MSLLRRFCRPFSGTPLLEDTRFEDEKWESQAPGQAMCFKVKHFLEMLSRTSPTLRYGQRLVEEPLHAQLLPEVFGNVSGAGF